MLVLFTDGKDQAKEKTLEVAKAKGVESTLEVFGIGRKADRQFLNQLAKEGHG